MFVVNFKFFCLSYNFQKNSVVSFDSESVFICAVESRVFCVYVEQCIIIIILVHLKKNT